MPVRLAALTTLWRAISSKRLFLAHCQFGVVLGLVTGQTLGRTRFKRSLGRPHSLQACLAPRQRVRDIKTDGQRLSIGRFGTCQQLLDLRLKLRLNLLRMSIRQRAVTGGVSVQLGAIQGHRAQQQSLHLPGDLQHLHEQGLNLRHKAPTEGA